MTAAEDRRGSTRRGGWNRHFHYREAPHWAALAAEELGINLLLAGHFATETFGIRALAALSREKIPG